MLMRHQLIYRRDYDITKVVAQYLQNDRDFEELFVTIPRIDTMSPRSRWESDIRSSRFQRLRAWHPKMLLQESQVYFIQKDRKVPHFLKAQS